MFEKMRFHQRFQQYWFTFTCALWLLASSVVAQPSALTVFASDTTLPVILTTDLKLLVKKKYKEEYQPAKLQIIRGANDTLTYAVNIRSRGNIRKEVCYFPPIMVKFPKEEFSYHKLKWVNCCKDSDLNESYVLREYLAYKFLSFLSEYHLDVYLMHVTYVDSGRNGDTFTRYAFVLQNEDEMAESFGGRNYEPRIVKVETLNTEQLALFTFFEYMIGNTDWAFGNSHNVMVFAHPASGTVMPVPYDFDYSGFVNTTYAVPNESLPIDKVTTRYNSGYCVDEDLCEKMRLHFLEKKDTILNYCKNFEPLDKRLRREATEYLEAFFDIMESPKETQRIFNQDCRQMN